MLINEFEKKIKNNNVIANPDEINETDVIWHDYSHCEYKAKLKGSLNQHLSRIHS